MSMSDLLSSGSIGGGSERGSIQEVATLKLAERELGPPPCKCCKLSMKTRLYGCMICFCIGFLMSVFSSLALMGSITGNLTGFVIPYTIGTIMTISG